MQSLFCLLLRRNFRFGRMCRRPNVYIGGA